MDGLIEILGIGESLMGEMTGFEIAPHPFDVVEFGCVFGQPLDREPMGAGGKRGGGCFAGVDRPVVEHDDHRFDVMAGFGSGKGVELFQERDEIGAAFGARGRDDQLAGTVVERPHHRDLLGLPRGWHAQVGAAPGPTVSACRSQRFRFAKVA